MIIAAYATSINPSHNLQAKANMPPLPDDLPDKMHRRNFQNMAVGFVVFIGVVLFWQSFQSTFYLLTPQQTPISEEYCLTHDFATVFVFTENAPPIFADTWWRWACLDGGCCLVCGVLLVVSPLFISARKGLPQHSLMAILGILGLLLICLGLIGAQFSVSGNPLGEIRRYFQLLNIYYTKQYELAEGTVKVLHTQPWSGHGQGDIVNIGGVEFEVNRSLITFGYDRTIAYGGALRDGAYARIYYKDDVILRVDLGCPRTNFFLPLVMRNT